MSLPRLTASLALSLAMVLAAGSAASALTVTLGSLPVKGAANPLASATTGRVSENVTGSVSGVRRSPWLDSPVDTGLTQNNPTALYSSVYSNSSATYSFGDSIAFTFLWGSPDSYNRLDFLRAGQVVQTVTSAMLTGVVANGANNYYLTLGDIAGGIFDAVRLSSTAPAFEYAMVSATPAPAPAPVPVPAGAVLLISALGGTLALRRRKTA